VGTNNEYLNFSKNSATLQKGNVFQEFDVIKYVKNNYILLSKLSFGMEIKKKYNIVSLYTKSQIKQYFCILFY